ncbi:unnamed protein product, partial [Polarella glacialis]
DRGLTKIAELQQALAEALQREGPLQANLAMAEADRARMEELAHVRGHDLSKVQAENTRLLCTNALQSKQLHALQALSCSECVMRAREAHGLREFFATGAASPADGGEDAHHWFLKNNSLLAQAPRLRKGR